MNKVKNTMQLVKESDRYVEEQYDMYLSNAKEICNSSKGELDAIFNAFRFGYMQALKATKAKEAVTTESGFKTVNKRLA